MSDKLISVIVPVYNVEKYLERCLDSIIHQTYTHLEIILVDDGSPDRCPEICDEYAEMDSRIIVIHKENGGISDARNVGMDAATGEWITFVDSDDWIEPEHIMSMIELHENTSCIMVSDVNRIAESQERIIAKFIYQRSESTINESVFGYVWNKLYPRSLIDGIKFDRDVRYAEDLIYNLSILERAPVYRYSGKATYNYVMREGSILSENITIKKIDNFIVFVTEYTELLKKIFKTTETFEKVYNRNIGNLCCNILCELTISETFKFCEKRSLIKKIMRTVCYKKIKLKYANHNLLRLLSLSTVLNDPVLFLMFYKFVLWRKRNEASVIGDCPYI